MSEEGSLKFTNEICVLLVEHDKGSLIHTTRLLEACSYKVVTVQHSAAALWILSERKQEFDFVLADIHLPDLDPFTLLHLTNNMGVRTILMSAIKDDMVLRRGLENGAYMVLEKPFYVETMRYLWQHVMREKISNEAAKDSDESGEHEEWKGKSPRDYIENEIHNRKNPAMGRRNGKNKEGFDQFDSISRVKRRSCTEWTEELHQKFVDAVIQLGEGRCYPKDILEIMKVPGLTRLQVASHLQKCRNCKWQPPKSNPPQNVEKPPGKKNPRKFGSMPVAPKECTAPDQSNHQNSEKDNGPPLRPPPGYNNGPSTNNYLAPNNVQLQGPYGTLSSVATNVEAIMSNIENQNERSNLNVQQGYIPSRKKKLLENFFELLPDNDEDIKNSYGRPEGSKSCSLDFDIAFSELQLSMAPNRQTGGK